MKRYLLVLLWLLATPALATHIVGGEFQFLFRGVDSNGQYRYVLGLVLYFDKDGGSDGARDPYADIRIFRKRDNAIVRNSIRLILKEFSDVQYSQPQCSQGSSMETERMYYTYMVNGVEAEYLLPPDEFNDPQGYYIAWERCCRNYSITNVYSEDPLGTTGRYAGQTFYLEFPPLQKEGKPFYNSSPTLFPPLRDYACPNRPYYVDFAGTDEDGDSLVYTLATPLSTHTGDPLPLLTFLPRPGPYPTVTYRSSFNSRNIMNGNPDLKIRSDGYLTVTPTVAGLYVFAVKCEEFRDGIKIGEVRRDFQMLVRTTCPQAEAPVIEAKHEGESDAEYEPSITVQNDNRCINVRVTDVDSESLDNNQTETVTLSAFLTKDRRHIDRKTDVSSVLPATKTAVLQNGSAAAFDLCFPECPFENGVHYIGIVVSDKACPLPRQDTLYVEVNVVPPPNAQPEFDKHLVEQTITEGGAIPPWTFTGTDADGDELVILPPPDTEIDLAQYGFAFNILDDQPGQITSQLTWDTRCDEYDFSKQTEFEFSFWVDDKDQCEETPTDFITFRLTRDIGDFHAPVIAYEHDQASREISLTTRVFEPVTFNVSGTDADNDFLVLNARGINLSMANAGALFPGDENTGNVSALFQWTPSCEHFNPAGNNEHQFEFLVVEDENATCHYNLKDTLLVTVTVEPPHNQAPLLTINGNTHEFDLAYTLGEEIRLETLGTDRDDAPQDMLNLELIKATGNVAPEGYEFNTAPERGTARGTFVWEPGCEIFTERNYENDYTFTFRVLDDRCYTVGGDTLNVNLKIKDVENDPAAFTPPNIITPNGDGVNEFFAMMKEDETTGELMNILPKDNCSGHFLNITIFNRWGREVFESADRDFRWYAHNDPTGMYFYLLKFSNKEYKGIITVAGQSQRNR